MAVEINLDVS